MRRTTSNSALLLALTCIAACNPCAAQDGSLQHHPWARFSVNSWKKVRVLTQKLGENGEIETTTAEETKTTLVQVDDARYTIKVETSVEVAGKRFRAEPKYVTRGYHGEVNRQQAQIEELGFGEVAICGRRYPSEIRRIVIHDANTRLVSEVHYSPHTTPRVLRRETTGTDGKNNRFELLVEVVALDTATEVLNETRPASRVKTVHRHASGDTTTTLEVHCAEIPGGVVSYKEHTLAASGRMVQRRTLELMAYHAVVKQGPVFRRPRRRGLFTPRR